MLRSKELFEKTCKDCGKVFFTERNLERTCTECKKFKKAIKNKKQNEEYRSVKPKPKPENKYIRETDALFAFVRKVDSYNAEHGTRYSYGQFVEGIHNGKIVAKEL